MTPLLDLPFLSHGHATLTELDASARFYSEFLGFEVIKTSPKTLVARLGSNTSIVGVTLGEKVLGKIQRGWLENAHIGLDMRSRGDVEAAHALTLKHQADFAIRRVGDLTEADGGLGFLITDLDGNFWEILNNPPGGYTDRFGPSAACDLSQALRSFAPLEDGEDGAQAKSSILKTHLMSHLTAEVTDIGKSREFYETLFGWEMVELGPKRMLARLNSVAIVDIIETDTENRDHKAHNHMGFDVAGPAEVDRARDIILANQERLGIGQIRKTSGSHGTYGFTFDDLDHNVWQIEDYPRGGYYWMFQQGGDLKNPFQPNIAGAEDWHQLIDPETYEYCSGST